MQKAYLLLRSNKQTGPYSIEELLQLNLKPFDLVWVEGRSAAWQYPSEIPALQPYVPQTPHAEAPFQPIATSAMEEKFSNASQAEPVPPIPAPVPQKPENPKRVFVSIPKTYRSTAPQPKVADESHRAYMPVAEPFQKGKDVRQTPSSDLPNPSYAKEKNEEEQTAHTHYARSMNEVEDDYTNWVYQQKKKKRPPVNGKDLVLAALILAVIGGGYYVMSRPSVANTVLPSHQAAAQTIQPTAEEGIKEPVSKTEAPKEEKTLVSKSPVSTGALKNSKAKNLSSVSKNQTSASVPPVQNPMPVEKTTPNIQQPNDAVVNTNPEVREPKKVEQVPAEKKKKLGEVIKTIFSKKEKTDAPKEKEVVLEEPKPADNRQAQRRESSEPVIEKKEEANAATLAEQVDVFTNKSDSWMMGIKNLKVTLRNRSNVTIQTAAVTVSYYDENNQLLEKKLVYFNNVAPRSKSVLTAPDNKWADHVDLKLTSVSGKEDRYASN